MPHAAIYAIIKMSAAGFCSLSRTRPFLMRYNPLDAGILLLCVAVCRCGCCTYFPLVVVAVNCFAFVIQFIRALI